MALLTRSSPAKPQRGYLTLSYRAQRALHQQSGRAGSPDDEGQAEDLRVFPHRRWSGGFCRVAYSAFGRPETMLAPHRNPAGKPRRAHRQAPRHLTSWGITKMKKNCNTKIAILIACYNRRSITLSALRRIAQVDALSREHSLQVFLLDDASPDGTGSAVRAQFPRVHVIEGTGNLFWNRGMIAAYKAAMAAGPWDSYVLMNDDIDFEPEDFMEMLRAHEQVNRVKPTIIVGSLTSLEGELLYSGFHRRSRYRPYKLAMAVPRPEEFVEVDTLSGNLVFVPGTVMTELDGLDPAYHHYHSDLDFGYRARKKDIKILLYTKPIGTATKNTMIKDNLSQPGVYRRFRFVFGRPDSVREYLRFNWQHGCRLLMPIYAVNIVTKMARDVIFGR